MLALRAALAQMSPQDRAAVLMRYVHGLEEEAVAQALGWRRLRLPRLYAGVTSSGPPCRPPRSPTRPAASLTVVTGCAPSSTTCPTSPTAARPGRGCGGGPGWWQRRRWPRPCSSAWSSASPCCRRRRPSAAGSVATAYLPSELPAYSWLTGDAAGSPPGPALVAWAQGPAVGLLGRPEFLVLGAGGAQVRRVAQAVRRRRRWGHPTGPPVEDGRPHAGVGHHPGERRAGAGGPDHGLGHRPEPAGARRRLGRLPGRPGETCCGRCVSTGRTPRRGRSRALASWSGSRPATVPPRIWTASTRSTRSGC
ncbi:MAG: sigma-70 region 4 domain-containing protein [Nocardioides sp.]